MRAIALFCIAVALGCGGEEPPAKAPEPAHAPEKPVPLVAKTSSELGSVDPAVLKRAFAALDDKYLTCQKRALDRVEVIAGNVKFFMRIGSDGSAKWAYLEETDLGDRETEKCLVDVVLDAKWPKPDAGDAEVRYSMELPLQATRPPSAWSAEKVAGAVERSGGAVDRCKAGATATFRATMYVGPGGRVLSAGVATPARDSGDQADCLAKTLLKMKGLPSPGSWPAKVTFGL
jgi:hypothetical protein